MREETLDEIATIADEIAVLLGNIDFVIPSATPEMLSPTVDLAKAFTKRPFATDDQDFATGVPPWIADGTEVAVRELLKDILRILMRETTDGSLEKLCAELINREMSAATTTFDAAYGSDSPYKQASLQAWGDIREKLRKRQLVMRSRLASAALQEELAEIKEVAAEVAQVAASSREDAGTVGELQLATYFDQLAQSEKKSANWFRGFAILILFVSASLVYAASGKTLSAGEIIRHVAFVLPALGLSTYLGAEAAKHRRSAQWAETVKVQLRTVGLYCAPMDDESTSSIRKLLANRVFGALPGETTEPAGNVELSPAMLEQLVSLVRASKG